MADISLTASLRSNLLSLQKTQSLMDVTQERLSTGKKVNSAIDNPSSYYTAQSLTNRANDLEALMDSMGQGIQTIKAADEAIKAITTFTQQAKAIANSAHDEAVKTTTSEGTFTASGTVGTVGEVTLTIDGVANPITVTLAHAVGDTGTGDSLANIQTALQAALDGAAKIGGGTMAGEFTVSVAAGKISITSNNGAEAKIASDAALETNIGISISGEVGNKNRIASAVRFDDILGQIDQLAKDAGYKGVNLLQENDLTVIFNEDRSSNIVIKGVDGSSAGWGLTKAAGWGTNAGVDNAVKAVDSAINELRTMASEFGNNYSVVRNREDFTSSLINVLTEGADKLTLADMNEESANMLALQTRQQLAINSLSLASQAAQSVLKLF